MTNEEIVAKMNEAVTANGGLDKSVKFDFGDDGCISVDGTNVSQDDIEADCTIKVDKDDFAALATGQMDPMMAFMSGKLKIEGDMSVAMSLQSLF